VSPHGWSLRSTNHGRRAWLVHGHRESTRTAKNPLLLRESPHALQSIICSKKSTGLKATQHFQANAQALWTIYRRRVDPFIRITFSWELDRLQSATVLPSQINITDAEDALVSAIYLASIVSLSEAECQSKLYQPKSSLLLEHQTYCEEAMASTNILCMKSTVALKAMVIYLVSLLVAL